VVNNLPIARSDSRLTEFDEQFAESSILARRKGDDAGQVVIVVGQLFLYKSSGWRLG
jgi:hypothetical protein